MNEFTNPAGNLGNNPFLQAPSTILPMKGKSPETGLAASISRPKSMIPVKRNRFDRYTAQQLERRPDIRQAEQGLLCWLPILKKYVSVWNVSEQHFSNYQMVSA